MILMSTKLKFLEGDMANYDYSKLAGKITEVFGSQRKYAQFMGWAERTCSEKLNSHTEYKQSEIMRTVTALGLSKSDIPVYFFAEKVQFDRTISDSQ